LQRNLETFARHRIKPFAVSYDSPDVLREFTRKHGITYPLLSDVDSSVIQRFGILNTHIPRDHEWYGVPYPSTYMLGPDGLVFEKTFFGEHGTRESINDMLQESFQIEDLERGQVRVVTTPYLEARAYFASPTVRAQQYTILAVEVSMANGAHVVAPSAPAGYVPLELELDAEGLLTEQIVYLEPEETDFADDSPYWRSLGRAYLCYSRRRNIWKHLSPPGGQPGGVAVGRKNCPRCWATPGASSRRSQRL